MDIEFHCEHTNRVLGREYREIHSFIDSYFDKQEYEKQLMCTDGDYYEDRKDLFSHRKFLHHQEGIGLVVSNFVSQGYDSLIVRNVAELHIRDDYQGYLPSKEDFDNLEFLKKYH